MVNLREWEKKYLDDVDVCIRLLETLKEDYHTPGYRSDKVNTSKVTRVRVTIHDLLKNH